jgi:hypothetical protein
VTVATERKRKSVKARVFLRVNHFARSDLSQSY